MSIAEIDRFQRAMTSSPDFGERIRAAGVGLSAIVEAARAEGFGFDLAELKAHMKARSTGMLSDEELAGVAAAGSTWTSSVGSNVTFIVNSTWLGGGPFGGSYMISAII